MGTFQHPFDPSNKLGHFIPPQWGGKNAGFFVDSYKSSLLYGDGHLYGTDNFILVAPGDTLRWDWEREIFPVRHRYAYEWFTDTIGNGGGEDHLGYLWEEGDYEALAGAPLESGWNGLIDGGENKIECLSIKKDAPEDIREYWQYPEPWYDGEPNIWKFAKALGSTMERDISSLQSPLEWRVGEPQEVSFSISDHADNDSIDDSNRKREFESQNPGEMVWLSEDSIWSVLSVSDVGVTRWQKAKWLDNGGSYQLNFEVTIPHKAFGRELGRDAQGNPLPNGETLYLIFTTGVDQSSVGNVVKGGTLAPSLHTTIR